MLNGLQKPGHCGFSLIELLIGILIMGILLSLAMPSFQTWLQNSQIRNAAESIQNGLQRARAEAVGRNANVELVLRADSSWVVKVLGDVDVDGDGVLDAGVDIDGNGDGDVADLIDVDVDSDGVLDVGVDTDGDRDSDVDGVLESRSGNEGSKDVTVAVTPAGATTVTFNNFGGLAATNGNGSAPFTRVDLDSSVLSAADSQNLRVTIGLGGNVRMCDPNAPGGSPRAC